MLPSLSGRAVFSVVFGVVTGCGVAVAVKPSPPVSPVSAPTTVMVTTTVAPTTTSLVTTTTTSPGPLIIQGVGDVNFDPSYIPGFRERGYEYAFTGLDGVLLDDHLSVINLECSPSDSGVPMDKTFIFGCDPAAFPVARRSGVEVANLANNHSQDYGAEAMLEGISNLTAAGIAPVGVGPDLGSATTPALFRLEGRTVAVLGFGGVHPASWWLAGADSPGMADGDDMELMEDSVTRAAKRADIVVVSIHWGVEGAVDPSETDRETARRMIAAGADVIFGHHPHRLGELEFVDGRPVFWTLGNFVWPRLSDAGATTAIGRVVFPVDGPPSACLVPVFIEAGGHPVLQGDPNCPDEP